MIRFIEFLFIVGLVVLGQTHQTKAESNHTASLKNQLCIIKNFKKLALYRSDKSRIESTKKRILALNIEELLFKDQSVIHWTFVSTGQNNTFYIRSSEKVNISQSNHSKGYFYFLPDEVLEYRYFNLFGDKNRNMGAILIDENNTVNLGSEFKWRVEKLSKKREIFMIWSVKYNEALCYDNSLRSMSNPVLKDKLCHWHIKCSYQCSYD